MAFLTRYYCFANNSYFGNNRSRIIWALRVEEEVPDKGIATTESHLSLSQFDPEKSALGFTEVSFLKKTFQKLYIS